MVAEGGITRFLAFFHSRGGGVTVGPVRSVRQYMLEIARGYGVPVAHAGGSQDTLAAIPELGIRSLDEIGSAGPLFWRSRDRRPPHNLYTTTDRLLEGANRRGWEPSSLVLSPVGAGDTGASDVGEGDVGGPSGGDPAANLSLVYSDTRHYKYTTGYRWKAGRYEKLVNGGTLLTGDGEPVAADNVVVLLTRVRSVGDAEGHMDVRIVGDGDALFFTGGKVYEGSWRKAAASAPFEFILGDRAMPLAPGVTWVNIIGEWAALDVY